MTTRPGDERTQAGDHLARLQALGFLLMTELARGATPMREVYEAFERAVHTLGVTHSGDALVAAVERAVRAEITKLTEVA